MYNPTVHKGQWFDSVVVNYQPKWLGRKSMMNALSRARDFTPLSQIVGSLGSPFVAVGGRINELQQRRRNAYQSLRLTESSSIGRAAKGQMRVGGSSPPFPIFADISLIGKAEDC